MHRVVLLAVLAIASCEKAQNASPESLDTYTQKEAPLVSRAQLRFYATSEGRMAKIETALKDMKRREAERAPVKSKHKHAAPQADNPRQQALGDLETATSAARAQVTTLKSKNSLDWEQVQAEVEAALTLAETKLTETKTALGEP